MDSDNGDGEHEYSGANLSTISNHRHYGISHSHRYHHDKNCCVLERCGRWLLEIPRDDVVALKQTSEYTDFLSAFDKLGEVRSADECRFVCRGI